MTRHVNTLHPKDDFECSLCKIKFQDKQAVQSHKKLEHSLKCSKCQNTYSTQSNFNRHKVSCCRCSRCKHQFDSLPELTNHTCEPPRKKARLDEEFTNRGKAVPAVCSQLSNVHPPTVVEECQPAAQRSPPVSVSGEELPTVVEECNPAVLCSPPVSVSVEEPPAVVEECHPAVKCSPPGTATAKDRPSASVDEVDERQSIPVRKKKSLKIKRPQKAKRNWRELEVIENEQLIEGNEELVTFMRLYWSSIRTFIRRGTVQNVFNFYFDRDFQDMVENIAVSIMRYRKNRFKINYGFGYVLKNIDTSQFRYYHVSNNNLMLDTAMLISTETELINWLNTITEQDFLANINRPDTKWRIVQITNVTFFVNKLIDAPLGAQCQLPDFITFNRGLTNVSGAQNLCLFRCLAIFKGAHPRYCERDAKDLFAVYCTHFGDEFNGVTFECLLKIEGLFKINIVVYSLEGRVASLVHRSRGIYDQTLKLNTFCTVPRRMKVRIELQYSRIKVTNSSLPSISCSFSITSSSRQFRLAFCGRLIFKLFFFRTGIDWRSSTSSTDADGRSFAVAVPGGLHFTAG